MSASNNDVRGVRHSRVQTEYQPFPEAYFSGSDVNIYFGDVWVDDLTGLQFSLQENLKTVNGYQSYTWDAISRGERMVQGSFRIAFREAGYLHRTLEHIGMLGDAAKPATAYDIAGESKPKWLAKTKETIEELLERSSGSEVTKDITMYEWPTMRLKDSGSAVSELQSIITSGREPGLSSVSPLPGIETFKTLKINSTGNEVRALQRRLNEYVGQAGVSLVNDLAIDGSYGALTRTAVRHFQTFASIAVDGIAGPVTRKHLSYGMSVTGYFGVTTKLAVMRFQRSQSGLSVDGIVGPLTRVALNKTVKVSTNDRAPVAIHEEYGQFEAEIWGRRFDSVDSKSKTTYFYGTDNQAPLRDNGFDIYVNYGPLPEAIAQNKEKVPAQVDFNTTVKAIRNVQVFAVSQLLDTSGQPIGEEYQFIARDLD